jgi:hypothetical protein
VARDRFGLGVNWLQQLTGADHDRGRAPLVPESDLPPMFRPDSSVHRGEQVVSEVDVGSLGVGERFWRDGHEYEVMRNNGARYVQATGVTKQANVYLEQDEEVEVKPRAD